MPSKRPSRGNGKSKPATRTGWYTPPRDPPPVIENQWRYAKVRLDIESTDGNTPRIADLSPTHIFAALKYQQGLDVTAALSSCKVLGASSYALPGIGQGGGQVFPSISLRVYSPQEDNTQGVLIDQRHDTGSLDFAARIGYKYQPFHSQRVLNGASNAWIMQAELKNSVRGLVYVNMMWTTNPN